MNVTELAFLCVCLFPTGSLSRGGEGGRAVTHTHTHTWHSFAKELLPPVHPPLRPSPPPPCSCLGIRIANEVAICMSIDCTLVQNRFHSNMALHSHSWHSSLILPFDARKYSRGQNTHSYSIKD